MADVHALAGAPPEAVGLLRTAERAPRVRARGGRRLSREHAVDAEELAQKLRKKRSQTAASDALKAKAVSVEPGQGEGAAIDASANALTFDQATHSLTFGGGATFPVAEPLNSVTALAYDNLTCLQECPRPRRQPTCSNPNACLCRRERGPTQPQPSCAWHVTGSVLRPRRGFNAQFR